MIRKKSSKKIVIDLTGPKGNAFVLLGIAADLCRQIGKDPEPLLEEMQSKDYEHLIQTLDKHFGHVLILER